MAAKRRKAKKASIRRIYARRAARRSYRVGGGSKLIQLDAMAYGALRAKASDFIGSIGKSVPFVNQIMQVSDEAVMGLIDWYAAKKTRGFVQKIAQKGLVIENARAGETVSGMFLPKVSGSSSSTVIYG